MSTHATIAAVMADNTITMTRINYDGYLDYTGRVLRKYFNNLDSISKLFASEVRAIDLDTGEINFYERNDYYPQKLNSIFEWYKLMPDEEYNYIFVNNQWFLYSPAKLVPLQDEDEYTSLALGEAQIMPEWIAYNDDLTKKIRRQQTKTLMALTQKALAPIDGHVRLGRFDALHVRVLGDFNLDYDLDSDLWRYPFYDGAGLAYIIYNSVVKHYEEAAKEKQCTFKKEDIKTVALVINYWNKIKGFDRAKNVLFGSDYLHYFLDALAGLSADYYESEIEYHKKGYVLEKINNLIDSINDDDKKAILQVFKKESDWDSHISAKPVFDYVDNMEKYGVGYKDMEEELEKDERYVKMRNLRDQAMVMCRESFMDQVLELVKR